MKVLKFGGTSVGTVKSLTSVKQIVEAIDEPVIVVVSALGGITDKLIATARAATDADPVYLEMFDEIVTRHYDVIDGMVEESSRKEVKDFADTLLAELKNVYLGLTLVNDLSPRVLNRIVSFGERLSSRIISKIISDATLFNSLEFIKTLRQFGKNVLNNELTLPLIHNLFDGADYKVAVVPGFISTDANGVITNLGRGGSDYTAAILAAALDADVLEIWTDVDGFMTADPRVVASPNVIDQLSFIEAMELCNFGAKVIYPPTIYPVFHKNIPIYIKNTFNPSAPGTCIYQYQTDSAKPSIKGVSSISDTGLVSFEINKLDPAQTQTRILNVLSKNGVDVILADVKGRNVSYAIRTDDSERVVEVLTTEFGAEIDTEEISAPRVTDGLVTIAVVGENLRHNSDVADSLRKALDSHKIGVLASAAGSSDTNLAVVVDAEKRVEALNLVHDCFFA